jgi:hypothetical protein
MHNLSEKLANVKVFASRQSEDAVLQSWQIGVGIADASIPNKIQWEQVGRGTLPAGADREVEEGFADESGDETIATGPMRRIGLFDPLVTAPGGVYAIILQSDQPFLCRNGGSIREDAHLVQLWGWLCSSGPSISAQPADFHMSNFHYGFSGAIEYEALQAPTVCAISASSVLVVWEPLFQNGSQVSEMRLRVSPEPPSGQPAAFPPSSERFVPGLLPGTKYKVKLQIRTADGGQFIDASSESAAVLTKGAPLCCSGIRIALSAHSTPTHSTPTRSTPTHSTPTHSTSHSLYFP